MIFLEKKKIVCGFLLLSSCFLWQICYDDGEKEAVCLAKERWEVENVGKSKRVRVSIFKLTMLY